MEKIKNLEMLRFLFALVIVCCHLQHGVINIEGVPLYKSIMENLGWSHLPVDFFFIISGFFLFLTTDFSQNFASFAKKKLIRFMPTILFVLALLYIISIFTPIDPIAHENIFTILNLQNVGLTFKNGDIPASWFVSSLFWTLSFYFYLYKCISKQMFNLITACTIFFCYSFWIHTEGTNFENEAIVFNLGMIRAFAGVGMGYFLSMLYREKFEEVKTLKLAVWQKLLCTCAEIYLFSFLFYYLCMHKVSYNNPLIMVIYFVGLFIMFVVQKGYFSKLFENNISVFLGKFAFAIFLTHQFVIKLYVYYIYQSHMQWVLHHAVINLAILWALILAFGITTYYAVETPCTKYLKQKIR